MPEAVGKVMQDIVAEYEATETLESRLAHDADKIETFLQAIEYQTPGFDAEAWKRHHSPRCAPTLAASSPRRSAEQTPLVVCICRDQPRAGSQHPARPRKSPAMNGGSIFAPISASCRRP